jgi:catechol 2,3-dioxygenase-like lactoylglutathione lyase family enzyme
MMGAFGRFLEVSVPARDVLASLAFYRGLGFAELLTGDIRPWHYAVVTDGRIAIGLHGAGFDEPALSFVRPNLARQVAALEAAGRDFELRRLGADEFHEAALRTPDGWLIRMMEARTWSPGAAGGAPPLVGTCTEVTLACADPAATGGFFEAAGFLPAAEPDGDALRLEAPGLTLGLRRAPPQPAATLRFRAGDRARALQALGDRGLAPAHSGEGHVLRAPEGTRLVIEP